MRIQSKIDKIFFLLLAVCMCFEVLAQNTLSSPYTKYGIGETDIFTNAVNASMGGVGYAMQRNNMVNYKNPASYTAIDTLSFVFDIGFYTNNTALKSNTAKTTGNVGGISHILFAFPIHKTLKIAGGLLPVSMIDFTASETHIKDTATIGQYKTSYMGDGGINKVFLGLAYRPSEQTGAFHNLSVGVNLSYLFGNYYRSKTLSFPDSSAYLSTRIENNYKISAFTADFGLQYFQPLKNGGILGMGLSYIMPAKLPTDNEYRHYTFSKSGTTERVRDSVQYRDEKGDIHLPQSIGFGISYEKPQKFFAAIDATFAQWSEFRNQGVYYKETLKDEYRLNAGLEYRPNIYGNYLQKISYRFGMNYSSGILELRDHKLSQYGISLGFGLPIKKHGTQINISLEYGKQGTKESNLIEKDYFRIGVSFSAKDRWFFKRKYQ